MSFGGKIGFVLIVVFTILAVLFFMLNAALGDCPTADKCISETSRAIMFYGSPLGGLIIVVLAYRLINRDRK